MVVVVVMSMKRRERMAVMVRGRDEGTCVVVVCRVLWWFRFVSRDDEVVQLQL